MADEGFAVLPIVGEDADAHAATDERVLPTRQVEGLLQALDDGAGHHLGALHAGQVFQHDDELVAAQAGHGVVLAQVQAQALGRGLQQFVAGLVAVLVVDGLEAVEVQEHDGADAFGAVRALQRVRQARVQQQAVGQVGQRVVVGQVLHLRFGVCDARDVGEHAHEVDDLAALVAHRADGQPARVDFTALAAVPDLALPTAELGDVAPQVLEEVAVVAA